MVQEGPCQGKSEKFSLPNAPRRNFIESGALISLNFLTLKFSDQSTQPSMNMTMTHLIFLADLTDYNPQWLRDKTICFRNSQNSSYVCRNAIVDFCIN